MHASWKLSLPEGYNIRLGAGEIIEFEDEDRPFSLKWKDEGIRSVVSQLVFPGVSVREFLAAVEQASSSNGTTGGIYFLQQLARYGMLWMATTADDHPLATLVPISPTFSLSGGAIPERPVILSRFAHTHRHYDAVFIESPLSHARVMLHEERAARVLHRLTNPSTVEELADGTSELTREQTKQLVQLLTHAGMLTEIEENGNTAEDEDEHLKYWEFHDLLFHAASREGRQDAPLGGTFLWAGITDPPPALPAVAPNAAKGIELYRPALTEAEQSNPSFSQVMQNRQSIRDYGEPAITADQLGEFLYNVGRVTGQTEYEFDVPGGPVTMDFAARPYPSAGGIYELEIYPLIQNCNGCDPGLYHYNAQDHLLQPTDANDAQRRELLQAAGDAAGIPADHLQVALIISARFGRISWKYSSMAYAAILKNVGSLYQTMYLTATAMGLAPCGLGAGNSDLFAAAIGGNYYRETSVGEFLLGSRGDVE